MDEFEKKLKQYRAQQNRKALLDRIQTKFKDIMNYGIYEKEKEDKDVTIEISVSIFRFPETVTPIKLKLKIPEKDRS